MMGQTDLERNLKKGTRIVKAECSDCPFLRLYSYPVCYCLHAIVDESTLCPYDYDLRRARKTYAELIETIRYWDEFIKNQIWGCSFVNVPER